MPARLRMVSEKYTPHSKDLKIKKLKILFDMNIRKGDLVIIKKGKDKGKTGKIIKVFPKDNRLTIEALNLVKKIKKAKKQGEKGEIILVPRPINRANAMLICPHCKKPTKIASKKEGKKKVRVCKKCGSVVS